MRQETNKEIDLLLRRLSRRDGEAARDAEMDERHLDADELSSYAQNALPAAARSRYTAHLAECSTCRRLATELSLALGVTTAAAPVVGVPALTGLKKLLSSLFSPMVLRYAVPALGVIVVMVVGFVVLRQNQHEERMAAQVAVNSPSLADKYKDTSATPTPPADQPASRQEQQAENTKPAKNAAEPPKSGDESAVPGKAPAEAEDAVSSEAPAPLPAPRADRSVAELRPVINATPTPQGSPKSVSGFLAGPKKEVEAKRQPESAVETADSAAKEKVQANEPARQNARSAGKITTDGVEQDKATATAPSAASSAGGRAATRRRAEEAKDDAEIRTVAGRKFRKERGIWTDTAYDSPTRTVQMARGSEQFRALVADEPAIGTIAEQLDGEVIVVWKGRAYRIR